MLASFLTVSQQVIIFFLLIGVGFVCGKTKFLADTAVTGMTDFVLYIVTPCVMIQSLQREFDAALAGAFLQAVLFAVITTFIGYFLARRTLHDQQPERESVYRFAAIFSNCGFMALPLESALLGPDGMFFGAGWVKRYPKIYPWSAFLCCASSITLMLEQQGILVPLLLPLLHQMPGYTGGFAWFVPTIAGILVGWIASYFNNSHTI